MVNEGLQAAEEKMRREGVPDAAIATFRHYYEQLVAGESGMLPDSELEPIEDIPEADALPEEADAEALAECADAAAERPELDLTPPRADRAELLALYEGAW